MPRFIVHEAQIVTRVAYFEHTIQAETFAEAVEAVKNGDTATHDFYVGRESDPEYGESGFGEDQDDALEAMNDPDHPFHDA